MQGQPTTANPATGAGQDFILFDDRQAGPGGAGASQQTWPPQTPSSGLPGASAIATAGPVWPTSQSGPMAVDGSSAWATGAPQQADPLVAMLMSGTQGGQATQASQTPSLDQVISGAVAGTSTSQPSSLAFTQHRGAPSAPGQAPSGLPQESPFSSPHSRLDDDFQPGTSVGSTSSVRSHATTASRKRARGQAVPTSMGGAQSMARSESGSSVGHRNSIGSASAGYLPSIPGLNQASSPAWSAGDTSPRQPPSGSFGPPIESLSLGSGSAGSAEEGSFASFFPSLFPENKGGASQGQPSTSQQPKQAQATQAANSGQAQKCQRSMRTSNSSSAGLDIVPAAPTLEQEMRARQQVQAELANVDSRALRGPLLDLQRGANTVGTSPATGYSPTDGSSGSGNSQGSVPAPSIQSVLFPSYQPPLAGQQPASSSSERPGVGPRRRSGSFDASFLPLSEPYFEGGSSDSNWSGQPTNSFNAWDLQLRNIIGQAGGQGPQDFSQVPQQTQQPAAQQSQTQPQAAQGAQGGRPPLEHQFSSRTQQAIERAIAQKPPRRPLTRDRSGLTVSPKEAFLDYDEMSSSPSSGYQSLFSNQPQGETTSRKKGKGGSSTDTGTPKASKQADFHWQGQGAAKSSKVKAGRTPSLTGSSVESIESVASPPTPQVSAPPLNRLDTAKPGPQQQAQIAAQAKRGKGRYGPPSRDESSSSGLSMFSASESATPGTDEENEGSQAGSSAQRAAAPGSLASARAAISGNAAKSGRTLKGVGPQFDALSSSDEDEDDNSRRAADLVGASSAQGVPMTPGSLPVGALGPDARAAMIRARPGAMGGYGYIPGSAESGLSYDMSSAQAGGVQMNPAARIQPGWGAFTALSQPGAPGQPLNADAESEAAQEARERSDSGTSADDDNRARSPSIRSSAQAIFPHTGQQGGITGGNVPVEATQQRSAASQHRTKTPTTAPSGSIAVDKAEAEADDEEEDEEDEDDDEDDEEGDWETGDDSDASDYAASGPKKASAGGQKKRRKQGKGARKHASATTGSMAGVTMPRPGATTVAASYPTTATGMALCDYVSPLTGERCGTEFHRPYDLARHRETIHAREEATLLKQGRMKKADCVVLYKEVDPATSLATVEWKCDGRNGCGSVFSRKDALLRHRRIRGH